jgi:putative transposase
LHSDRGGQFISGADQKFLGGNAPGFSMSAVGHGGDNAACEGSVGVLKRERVHRTHCRTRDADRADMSDYLERLHDPRMRRRVARHGRAFQA